MDLYNKQTQEYLNSKERQLADKLINYQMSNEVNQQQMADVLGISLEKLLLVEFNHPDATAKMYREVAQLFKQLEI